MTGLSTASGRRAAISLAGSCSSSPREEAPSAPQEQLLKPARGRRPTAPRQAGGRGLRSHPDLYSPNFESGVPCVLGGTVCSLNVKPSKGSSKRQACRSASCGLQHLRPPTESPHAASGCVGTLSGGLCRPRANFRKTYLAVSISLFFFQEKMKALLPPPCPRPSPAKLVFLHSDGNARNVLVERRFHSRIPEVCELEL